MNSLLSHPPPARRPFAALLLALALVAGLAAVPARAGVEDFYQVPDDIADFPIGGVVRSEPVTDLSPPLRAALVTRVMYRSDDGAGGAIGITGAVLVPRGAPPVGGWPVLAWAHGTTGVGLECAPSQTPNLFEDNYAAFVAGLVAAGYVVVATDYEGLGTGPLHKYLNLDSEARSVIDGVRAARELVPAAGNRWLVLGHSEGGHASVGTGELAAARAPELQFLGTIPIAPGADLLKAFGGIDRAAHREQVLPYISYIVMGMKATNPAFDPAEVMSPEMLPALPLVEQLCLSDLGLFYQLVFHPRKVLADNWQQSAYAVEYLTVNEPGMRPSAGPLLVLEGTADIDVAPPLVDALVARLKANGQTVDYRKFPGDDHETILRTGFPTILDFANARFFGSPQGGRRVSPLCGQAGRLLALLYPDLTPNPFFTPPVAVEARAVAVNLAAALRALDAARVPPAAARRVRAPLTQAINATAALQRVIHNHPQAVRKLVEAATLAARAEQEARRLGL